MRTKQTFGTDVAAAPPRPSRNKKGTICIYCGEKGFKDLNAHWKECVNNPASKKACPDCKYTLDGPSCCRTREKRFNTVYRGP